jgi:glycosyltransferase involved in cell wall biosynthesis
MIPHAPRTLMRVLFVSGTSAGGAARSSHELADVMARRGHGVTVLMRNDRARFWTTIHRRAVNLRVKLGERRLAKLVDVAGRQIGTRLHDDITPRTYSSLLATRPENAARRVIKRFRPDVVVVNSIDLPAWRQLRNDVARLGLPVVLYIREETGLLHLSHSRVAPDFVVANATGHAERARELGHDAIVVPSIVDCAKCRVESTRERVLLVNPTAMYGVDVALALATARPDIPFTFAESIPLEPEELAALQEDIGMLGNVELQRSVPDARQLYSKVRLLLAPYRYPGRSRVIAEAQCSGIPALASTGYGVAEEVGEAGVTLDPDGPIELWIKAIGDLWDDPEHYERLSAAARRQVDAPDRQPNALAARFEDALLRVVLDARS